MERTRLICFLALSGLVAMGCGDDANGTGGTGAPGGGGSGGTGPTGGTGATRGVCDCGCTNAAGTVVYGWLSGANDDAIASTRTVAAAPLASLCKLVGPPR